MNSLFTGLLVFAGIFCAALLAMRLRAFLPERHQSPETKDTVKVAMALVGTMTALLLGLMVASAKSTYDAQKASVITTAANLVMLDRMLAHYGPEADPSRESLRGAVGRMVTQIWPESPGHAAQLDPNASRADVVFDAIEALVPQNDPQKAVKALSLNSAIALGQTRWLLFEQSGHSIAVPLLGIVIAWLALLFFSFGLFAPANGTAVAALMVSALSVAGAIFLILELDQPFDGLIHIPSAPMHSALAHITSNTGKSSDNAAPTKAASTASRTGRCKPWRSA